MKTLKSTTWTLFFAFLFVFVCFCTVPSVSLGKTKSNSNHVSKYSATTQQLVDMVEHNAQLKALLIKSIAQAKELNPDRYINPVQSIDEYYAYIEWSIKALPWENYKRPVQGKAYDEINQNINYFYFLNDRPLKELEGKGYYHNSIQYMEPYRSFLVSFNKTWGAFLDTEASWSKEAYEGVRQDERFGLSKGWYEDPSRWTTFNQFFARHLDSPAARPIASPRDSSVLISPADAEPQGVWQIDDQSIIRQVEKPGVIIKSKAFDSVADLIGPGSAYNKAFAGGTLTHTFLDVMDYHRYHFPMAGKIKEVRLIYADDAIGGSSSWNPTTKRYTLQATAPGWQSIETRGCVILETEDFGLVAILPIGMSQICSVNFEKRIKPGVSVQKGDQLGYFLFGGSDVVMLFQKGVKLSLTVPEEGKAYKHILMGEPYGKLSR